MMHLFLFILLLSISSLVLVGQTCDIGSISFANLNNPPTDFTCTFNPKASLASLEPAATREPWTRKPKCIQNPNESYPLCVFTVAGFAQGRGISLLTDPSTAQSISQLPAFTEPNVLAGINIQADSPPFVIRELLGRGRGVIANWTIERGDLIMAYTATTIFHKRAFSESDYHMLHTTVNQLPKPSRALWLDLVAHFEGDMYKEKIKTNAFSEKFNEEEHYVVIPEVARFNHDCRPNAMYFFDIQTLTQNVHASRTIYAGEEITVTYIDPLQIRRERRAATKHSWGFECTCSLCTQSASLTRASDERIKTILELTEYLQNWEPCRNCKATPEMAELLISLYEQERLHGSIAEAYVLAALAYNAVGSEWMAVKYGMKALEVGIINNGPNDLDVTDMRELVRATTEHWSWMARMRDILDDGS